MWRNSKQSATPPVASGAGAQTKAVLEDGALLEGRGIFSGTTRLWHSRKKICQATLHSNSATNMIASRKVHGGNNNLHPLPMELHLLIPESSIAAVEGTRR
jgi:hypothetical protein